MTVFELIAELQKHPSDMRVFKHWWDSESGDYEEEEVTQVTVDSNVWVLDPNRRQAGVRHGRWTSVTGVVID